MVPRLAANPNSPFPPAETALAEPDGLLAWGGDLEPLRLINAYRAGIFPWYTQDQPILWWSPSKRCVLEPSGIHVSRRLARLLRQKRYAVTADRAFARVVAGCARPRKDQDSTWITEDMASAYETMHQRGYGHSVEVWAGEDLVGGIYGLALGRMFFGESMYSEARDASKVAMVCLCRQLQNWDFRLLDCQVCNPHLERMGAVEIERRQFLEILRASVTGDDHAGSWCHRFSEGC